MLNDFKKSIQLVLNERIANPFSGAFFFSWFVWNWKLIYYLFGADSKIKLTERIGYVESNYLSFKNTLLYPFLSAVFLIAVYPFITTGALWIWLKFKRWQAELKNSIEGHQLLTIDQSLAIRLEIQNQQDRFDRLLKSKDEELLARKTEIERLQQSLAEGTKKVLSNSNQVQQKGDYSEEIQAFLNNQKVLQSFPKVMSIIQNGYAFGGSVPTDVIGYLEGHDVIQKKAGKNSVYEFSEKGKLFLRAYSEKH